MRSLSILLLAAAAAFAQEAPPAPPAPKAVPVTPVPPKPRISDEMRARIKENAERHVRDIRIRMGGSSDHLYEAGQRALDNRRWDEALADFTKVAESTSPRTEGALYWKAYTLHKMGRKDEAVATANQLHSKFPNSRWNDDMRALEGEISQGTSVGSNQPDDELKLLALNNLVRSEPDRAVPIVEKLLKSSQSPRIKKEALFVLAQSKNDRARDLLINIAKGGGNPDLQLTSLSYLAAGRNQANAPVIAEVYGATQDQRVKRETVRLLGSLREKDRLVGIAKNDPTPEIRIEAVRQLINLKAPEIPSLYASETNAQVKESLLGAMIDSAPKERLVEMARTEKEAKVRDAAIRALSSRKTAATELASLYASESDNKLKRDIISGLRHSGDAKGMVEIGRKESDPAMKRYIVEQLSGMKSKEATDYMLEILK